MDDIIIRGFDLGNTKLGCPFRADTGYGDCYCVAGADVCYANFDERGPDCPVDILPEGHGRLIDAERFRVILCRLKERQNDDVAIHALNWAIECLDKLDTIVPAEGGGEK